MKQAIRRFAAHAISRVPLGILCGAEHADIYERRGFHIVRDYFYEPIPNVASIDRKIWDRPSQMVGVDARPDEQRDLLTEFQQYFFEYRSLLPALCQSANQEEPWMFGPIDGPMLYAMVRHQKPRSVIEVGAGHSTLIALAAIAKNGVGRLTSIDPYPQPFLQHIDRDDFALIPERVERLPLSFFEELENDGILFIDSSHVIKVDGDVLYEVLEIVPRLKPGCLVHIHDIFMPNPYPKEWTLQRRTFWSEQYLVWAFLCFNSAFQVKWSSAMMEQFDREILIKTFGKAGDSSLWLSRVV